MTGSSALPAPPSPFAEVPHCTRAFLRVEMADGQVREFDVEAPRMVDVATVLDDGAHRSITPDLDPFVITAAVTPVLKVTLQASIADRHPMVMRTEGAESPQAKLAAIRELIDGTLDLPDGPAAAGVLVSRLMGILGRAVTP